MRFIPKRPSIEEETLKVFLDRTAAQHNGIDHAQYRLLRYKLGPRALADAMNIKSTHTIYKYNALDDKEQANVKTV